jgi:hypothetical protein
MGYCPWEIFIKWQQYVTSILCDPKIHLTTRHVGQNQRLEITLDVHILAGTRKHENHSIRLMYLVTVNAAKSNQVLRAQSHDAFIGNLNKSSLGIS